MEGLIDNIAETKSVLSIQSHVVHGYVGNKASSFPLQMLNWEVDLLNTVNLSNHTGYGSFKGSASTKSDLLTIFEGLKKINVEYDALLTGYSSGYDTLEAVGDICIGIKNNEKSEKNVTWLLDTVMGDEGVLYVDENVIPVYKKLLESQLVDIITPNQFELEILLDHKITCLETLKKEMKLFHEKYKVKHVILSTLYADGFQELEGGPETLYCCVSSISVPDKLILYKIDKIDGYFTGVGDMFSALLLDRITKLNDIIPATNQALSVMKKVLTVTKHFSGKSGSINDANMKDCELRVIECKNIYNDNEELYQPIFIPK
ncbi:putative pyridoxal kinase [Pichia kluyveri]|uniref:pyridoxal kinase n=1 Tax=Pichia kluyveri TaxID=36015 RepID=A0AAV5R883_PICKL|nr:putative pyridoxal kinase [Pichia kluyveri]